jgi:hypothetical protein
MPPPKNYIKIKYPRKCEHCDYVSNNPSMYHYHERTHDPIPDGQLCDHGCGKLAQYRGTGGKYTCEEKFSLCAKYLSDLANRTRLSWVNDNDRKEETKKSLINRLHNEENYKKSSETKRKKFGTLDPVRAKEYRHYARFIRQRAQKWAKEQGHILGQQTYHVDHKLSILDAWKLGLSEQIVNHPANLQILEAKVNSGKGSKSSITVEELLTQINQAS